LAGAAGIISRQFLYNTAYNVEADLRSLIYQHLTWLSFSFYDRVQSGQLISRANSDIRSVQMYSIFAPLIIVQCFIGVVAFGFMLILMGAGADLDDRDARFCTCRHQDAPVMFPISWITQARLAEVATIVDENVNGVRVVKSFAQEEAEIDRLADAAKVLLGLHQGREHSSDLVAWSRTAPIGLALVLLCGGWMVLHGDLVYPNPRLQSVSLDAPGTVHDARPARHDGTARQASAGRIFEILDENPEIVERPAPTTSLTYVARSISIT